MTNLRNPTDDHDAASRARAAPLPLLFKLGYGTGAKADGIVNAGFGFFLLFYLTAVCGMSGTMAGSAKMVALLVDAVLDPAIGLASDRARSRLGRRLPFMIGALIPFVLAFGLLFSIPASLAGLELFVYVTVCLIVLRLSLSCFVLPFTAVGAEATDDYRERANVVSYRLTFQSAGVLVGVVLGLGIFMAGPNGLLQRENYVPYGWSSAAAMLVAGIIAIAAVSTVLARLHGPAPGKTAFFSGFLRELAELSRNRSFLLLFGTVLIYFLAYATWTSLTLHAARYFWNLDAFAIQIVVLSSTLGPLIGAPLSAYALRHIEKRSLAIGAFLAIALLQMWPQLLHIYGPFTIDADAATIMLAINGLLVGTAIMVGGVGFQSMLADTADEHELLFGVRREGLFFSGLTLAYKGSAALGGLIAGIALDLIQFPADIASRGANAEIADAVLVRLGLISGPLPALFAATAPLFLLGYQLTRQRHAQIVADLAQRNAARSTQ